MKLYTLSSSIALPISREEAWEFLSNPNQLETITSNDLAFEMLVTAPEKMYEGMIIRYQIKPFPGIKLQWIAEITHVEEGVRFVDEQRFGPFRFWHHEHRIAERGDGVELQDIVHYVMPLSLIGRMVHALFVRRMIEGIFDDRKNRLKDYFPVD